KKSYKSSSILSQNRSYLLSTDPDYDVSKLSEIINKKQKWSHIYSQELYNYLDRKVGYLFDKLGYERSSDTNKNNEKNRYKEGKNG
ncbi:MAG: hypothetical protein ABFR75_12545, partial [Acidobacteriota bacterium]